MKGEEDRDCRASGGKIQKSKNAKKQVVKEFHGAQPANSPDASLDRGGPIFRKRGGKVEHEAEGDGKKPNLGRAGRARGGGVGSDLKPLTSAESPKKPKGKRHFMPESEATP